MADKSDDSKMRKKEGVDLVALAIGDFGRFQALICALHSYTCALFLWQVQ